MRKLKKYNNKKICNIGHMEKRKKNAGRYIIETLLINRNMKVTLKYSHR